MVADPLSIGSGEFLALEFPACYWLEKSGYKVTYCSNSDLITPDVGLRCAAFLSLGHDECVSRSRFTYDLDEVYL